jgi:hypothetical protein
MRHNYLLTGAIRFFQFNQYKLFSNTPTERRVLLIIRVYLKKDLINHQSNMYLLSSPYQSLVKKFLQGDNLLYISYY